jgi:hypothetical protein
MASLGLVLLLGACGGGSGDGSSGQCGGSGCGGDVVGTWVVQSVCIDSDAINDQLTAQLPSECSKLVVSASATPDIVTTFNADGTAETSGSLEIYTDYNYTADCLRAQGSQFTELSPSFCQALGESAEQAANDGGDLTFDLTCMHQGNACYCVNRTTAEVTETTTYSVGGSELTEDGELSNYCVEGNTLTVNSGSEGVEASYTATRQ